MKRLVNDMVKIVVVCVAMAVAALAVPTAWVGVPVILGIVVMGCVALDR